ncbi:inorganic phosphate transporter [Pseudogracilibacillus sp. SO30301A]
MHEKNTRIFLLFVIGIGFLESFSAGMNNAANAVGLLVGAGVLSTSNGMLLGGIFAALGAMLLGGGTIETNGKKITALSLIQGVTVSITSTILVIVALLYGIPVPMTQITTSGIVGIGASQQGVNIFRRNIIKKIVAIWVVSPLLSLVIAYTFFKFIIENDFYTSLAIVSVLSEC